MLTKSSKTFDPVLVIAYSIDSYQIWRNRFQNVLTYFDFKNISVTWYVLYTNQEKQQIYQEKYLERIWNFIEACTVFSWQDVMDLFWVQQTCLLYKDCKRENMAQNLYTNIYILKRVEWKKKKTCLIAPVRNPAMLAVQIRQSIINI